ncbi:DUF3833 domain-containing protein [Azoarcus sp. L1K30]|uniref:DUF3833 domain-containing protein n=1 Tax=Azoarcus sp. L1K30 TaxID=2820277 RepID=UPI001B81FC29|nr:DUF3833 domain-containing protein [Azoarcus sp. L1K30]MBR0567856.1 DUF3833 domain-containing protein [Azoarcus sp. L1K30]
MKKRLLLLTGLLALAGCTSVDIEAYRNTTPELDLRSYFNGTLDAHGMFQNRSGEVVKRFHVLIEASWKGDVGTLDERFTYADGSTQRRVWTITRHSAQAYVGTADDVVGEARGEARGNALRWRYVMALPVDGKVYNVDFDDWMFLMDDRVMLNRSVMSKWGVRLGEVTLSFYKRTAR